jgi:hypothetical protein
MDNGLKEATPMRYVPSPASRPDLVEIGPLGVASHYGWPKIRIVDLGGG